jgi:hypothetical protein
MSNTWLLDKGTAAMRLVVAAPTAVAGTVAPAATAAGAHVVDLQECGRNGGQATVPAGVPVSVQNFAFVTGTYGRMRNFLLKQTTSKGLLRGGVLTIVDVTAAWSEPELIGTGPGQLVWLTRLPDTELDPLAPGESVGVGYRISFSGPIEIAFPPVGLTNFGPFHLDADDVLIQGCSISTA